MRNLFSRTVIYISVGLHLLMLHAGEKWAAAEYSTSPPQEEEEEEVKEGEDGGRWCVCVWKG